MRKEGMWYTSRQCPKPKACIYRTPYEVYAVFKHIVFEHSSCQMSQIIYLRKSPCRRIIHPVTRFLTEIKFHWGTFYLVSYNL